MLLPGIAEKYAASEQDVTAEWSRRSPDWGEYMGASVAEGFERSTTGALFDHQRVIDAEDKAYGLMAPAARQAAIEHTGGQYDPWDQGAVPTFIAKEDWNEKHPLYRKGVEWREGFTPERARIYAEDHDKREYRNMLLQQGKASYGFLGGSVPGFFAGVLGSLPDPVNLVPFGRAAGAGKGFWAGAKSGVLDGALGAAMTDAFVLPDLKSRGADVGVADFALDVAFGAAIGGLLGEAGGWLGAKSEARAAERERARRAALTEETALTALEHDRTHGSFADAGRDRFLDRAGETPGLPASTPAHIPESPLARNEVTDAYRQRIHGDDRQTLLRAADHAVDSFSEGRPVDMAPVLQESTALARIYEQALFHPLLASDPHSPQARLMYGQLANELGVALGDIHVDIGTGAFNAKGRMEIARETSFGMVKFIWKHGEGSGEPAKMRVTKEDITGFPRLLREYLPDSNEQGGYQWVIQAPDGRILRYVAKNFADSDGKSHLVTVHAITKSQAQRGGFSKRIADLASSREGLIPSPEIPQGALTNQAFAPSRASLGQESAIHQSGEHSITPDAAPVKPLDLFAKEAPEEFSPAPPVSREAKTALEEMGVDPATGRTVEEARAIDQIERGLAGEEEAEHFLRAEEAKAEIPKLEEAGLAALECVMEVMDDE